MLNLDRVRAELEQLDADRVHMTEHGLSRILDERRQIDRETVCRAVLNAATLLRAEPQIAREPGEAKLKLWFKLSSKYALVIVAVLKAEQGRKHLYIVSTWKVNISWQRLK
ncbi:hypothetical protein HY642_03825 [Candidatus Woesearchaeota archaeon]|nr:hypothetical protein [Candidatus Woesearchaeota archaeon]